MKIHFLFIALMIGGFTISCGNSSKNQQTEATTQQVNPLEKVFKEAYEKKETLYELLRQDIVKKRIIEEYSQKYYDKMVQYVQIVTPIEYKNNVYTCFGGEQHNVPDTRADVTYNPLTDQLEIRLIKERRVIQHNGEIHYNTEGWEIQYPKDEFNEDIKSEPFLFYSLMGDREIRALKLCITIVPKVNGMSFYTNEFNSGYDIKQILIKDNISGKIYNLYYDKLINNNAGNWFRDIGVVMYGTNLNNFVNLVSSLSDYTISIGNENDENVVIKNPKNLCNIRDAIEKLLMNNEK